MQIESCTIFESVQRFRQFPENDGLMFNRNQKRLGESGTSSLGNAGGQRAERGFLRGKSLASGDTTSCCSFKGSGQVCILD